MQKPSEDGNIVRRSARKMPREGRREERVRSLSNAPIRNRRRHPLDAEREILHAAEAALKEKAFSEVSVDDIMRRTTLSRPSFYRHFRDRHHLVLRLFENLIRDTLPLNLRWFRGKGDPRVDLRRAVSGVVKYSREHGPLLRAIIDAAGQDRRVEAAHRKFLDALVSGNARRIRHDIRKGVTKPLEPNETAMALFLMSERYIIETLGRENPLPTETVEETLYTIFSRVLYGSEG